MRRLRLLTLVPFAAACIPLVPAAFAQAYPPAGYAPNQPPPPSSYANPPPSSSYANPPPSSSYNNDRMASSSGRQSTYGGQASSSENCGTPDEPKACPPLPRRALPYYPPNRH